MGTPIRYLHLSDFHIGKDDFGQSDFCEKIVAHVSAERDNGNIPDLIFLTGDIANKGQRKDYEKFRTQFYSPLIDALGSKWKGHFFAVPGNHDVARPPSDGLNPDELCRPGTRLFDYSSEGKSHRDPQVIPRFKQFKQLMPCSATSDWIAKKEGAFAENVDIQGSKVGIIGINTAWLSREYGDGEGDREKLTPGLPLVENALKQVKDCAVRIVLGHHPLHWLRPDQQPALRALFGEYGVLYLHGHLHRPDGRREDGGGREFLALQSGAAFQVRPEDTLHKNGLIWGELDLGGAKSQLHVNPRFYNPDNRDWPTETGRFPENRRSPGRAEWWVFPLPTTASACAAATWQTPPGWQRLDRASLDALRRELTLAEAARYFDGAEPEWATVLSDKLPQRAVVGRLTDRIAGYDSAERPLFTLLTGPSGEGKSTVLRQVVVNLAARGWNILWRQDVDSGLPEDALSGLPESDARWLIVTDAADLLVSQLHQAAIRLANSRRSDVHFLFCTRSSDWNVSGANMDWGRLAHESETLSGLDPEDARLIAQSWQDFDATNDDATDIDTLAIKLEQAAKEEASFGEGALLGGVLVMRRGAAGLRAHVHALLARLAQTRLQSGKSLRDALAYIAAMHAEGLDFLSRPVLAEVLGCGGVGALNSQVLHSLGREAAAGGGTFIRTRHRRIAAEVMAIQHDDFGLVAGDYLLELAKAAKLAFQKHIRIPVLNRWDFDLPKHFLDQQNFEAAINIGIALYELDPSNVKLASNLASIYRDAKEAGEGEQLLRQFAGVPDRGYWLEWSTCAGFGGDPALASWLAGWSLADQRGLAPPRNRDSMLSLAGLGINFGELYAAYNNPVFNDARLAVAQLGFLTRPDARAWSFFEDHRGKAEEAGSHPASDLAEMFERLQAALRRAWECCAERELLAERLPNPVNMGFDGLKQLFKDKRSD
jgi:predicted MPP superfamily phosphohydrolase